ncbi:type VI secretion system baseplate subunit TssG [Xanthobacter agilis]|uniref:Type VI secretion system protein ImpH n=1 Tax=Xanthobacter agilis TaxID=47492 RepID=A0ABU0LEP7_XANAG|nr:type VI secretion system baseplate subunit TssG [Xanthobacter agilis]MDQ0505589.1 type VI secretion system protein ImpH [Xanthobacter agilis]
MSDGPVPAATPGGPGGRTQELESQELEAQGLETQELELWAFFALIQHLERLFPDAPPFGGTRDPQAEAVRFHANPSLGYPAREVERLVFNADGTRADVTVNFLGLQGPSSPLPPFYTEQVIEDAADGGVLSTFLDLFNHRLVSLLVRVHKHHRHALQYERGAHDAVSQTIAALMGLLPGRADRRRVALLPYAGLLSCYSLSASIIAPLIGHCTDLPVRIDEFVPRVVTIPAHLCSRLGDTPPELGVDFIVGADVMDHTGKFRLVIGPVDGPTFARLMPDQPLFAEVLDLLMLALKDPLAFDLRIEIKAGERPAFALGEGQLGWNTWAAPPDDAGGHVDFAADRLAPTL